MAVKMTIEIVCDSCLAVVRVQVRRLEGCESINQDSYRAMACNMFSWSAHDLNNRTRYQVGDFCFDCVLKAKAEQERNPK